ncbi:hypothetical protein NE649_11605 [Bacteroides uniformis]|nr:hypothetical protein [Bacteroides uniformis]
MKNQRTERRHYKIFCVNVIGCFTVYKSSKDYPEKLRKLIIENPEDGTRYIFLTNNLDASAELVSSLYLCYNNRFATLAYWIFTLVGTGGPAPWRWPFPDR